ncbi:MAG TPA: hypothetical protein VGL94_02110 [Ktedonobacteraceae bacterium]|jgi:hypothetical protein
MKEAKLASTNVRKRLCEKYREADINQLREWIEFLFTHSLEVLISSQLSRCNAGSRGNFSMFPRAGSSPEVASTDDEVKGGSQLEKAI